MSKVPNVIYIGEFGHDPDEEGSLLLLTSLHRAGLINFSGVIANRNPAIMRARLAAGTLEVLGMPDVPVALGSECMQARQYDEKLQFAATYLSGRSHFESAEVLFWRLLSEAKDKSVAVVCASGLTDVALLLSRVSGDIFRSDKLELLKQKVSCFSIMGGVLQKDDVVLLDEDGRVVPTKNATNNGHDFFAAEYVYTQIQRMEIPLMVLSKHAAYAASVERSLYDTMAATGHPIGFRLLRIQRTMIQYLWWRANLAGDDPRRDGLPPVLGREWFFKAFFEGEPTTRGPEDSIWDLIKRFNMYDQMACMAAIPSVAEQFFAPVVISGKSPVSVIGVNAANHQVQDVAATRQFLLQHMMEPLKQVPVF